ncbi:alcohol dehydrogenase [[Pantoea] beijingensis]|uniref:Alcohol dehydrogenase n=1 Tax=[Pantoea] beijingensis TaxID=1324864 RepID=A0A443I990_9GAMM|nr:MULTISPECIES: iron-containing alcohol dehydrogenase [Erwiniaceae]RWR00761.1 alcohol dehydrogenase [[Pantoea] beijingensis]
MIGQMIANRKTFFGNGSLHELLPLLTSSPCPTLLFCARSFLNGPAYAEIKEALSPLLAGIEIVSHEASSSELDEWVTRWRGKVSRVVAIGGGSVMDAAKAVAALCEHPLNTRRYLEKVGDSQISGKTLPLIAIPTTAGTGSEVTQNAVVTDKRGHNVKASLRHAAFVPEIAILDPQLLKGASDHVLACCAIDAFTHLFEAYLSKSATALSQRTALSGMQAFVLAWPVLNQQGETGDDAREQMMLASWLGGQSLSMAGLGVIHGLAGELGAIKDYHHGEVCGRLLFPFLTLLSRSDHPQQQQLMHKLNKVIFGQSGDNPALHLAEWLKQHAITPFWQQPQLLDDEEIRWILARSNSKNSLIDYSPQQQHFMLKQAWPER